MGERCPVTRGLYEPVPEVCRRQCQSAIEEAISCNPGETDVYDSYTDHEVADACPAHGQNMQFSGDGLHVLGGNQRAYASVYACSACGMDYMETLYEFECRHQY